MLVPFVQVGPFLCCFDNLCSAAPPLPPPRRRHPPLPPAPPPAVSQRAAEVEKAEPKIAYYCRMYALEQASGCATLCARQIAHGRLFTARQTVHGPCHLHKMERAAVCRCARFGPRVASVPANTGGALAPWPCLLSSPCPVPLPPAPCPLLPHRRRPPLLSPSAVSPRARRAWARSPRPSARPRSRGCSRR